MVVMRVFSMSMEEAASIQVRCPTWAANGCAVTTKDT